MNENTENTNAAAEGAAAEIAVIPEETPLRESGNEPKNTKPKRQKNDIFDVKKDIWYRGPLSYRHLKALGWLCIVLTQIGVMESLKFRVLGTANEFFLDPDNMNFIAPSALPLILISIFAYLLRKRENYKNALIVYGSLFTLVVGLSLLIYGRYILGLAGSVLGESPDLAQRLDEVLYNTGGYNGYISFNMFVDVFLCILVMFFLDYEPKRFFTGKKLVIFRALVALPLSYEVVCIVLKVMATDRIISLPMWVSPFLTTEPPVSILMFLSIVRYIKLREKRFFDSGRTNEQYAAFLETNVNSFQFSKHLILIILSYSVLDLILVIVFTSIHLVAMNGLSETALSSDAITASINAVSAWGFGKTARMIDLLPIVLLLSYTRSYKQPLIDIAIPFAGVVAVVIVYIDGIFQLIRGLIGKRMITLSELFTVLGA